VPIFFALQVIFVITTSQGKKGRPWAALPDQLNVGSKANERFNP